MLDYPMVEPYPIVCVLGKRGSGKTLTTTTFADRYIELGIKVFSNYKLIGIPYQSITFEELAEFPDYLHDCIVLLDEIHIGADSYAFFSKRVKNITTFVTQLRKRRIRLFYTTQNFMTVARRLRNQTDLIMEVNKTIEEGVIDINMFWRDLPEPENYIKSFKLDCRASFGKYDTNEIIQLND